MPNFFDKEKYVLHYENLQLCLRLGLKLKKTSRFRIQSITMVKPYIKFNTQKGIEAEKNGDKGGKPLCKLMKNVTYRKTMGNFRTRTDKRHVNNDKKLFEMDIKTKLYVAQNI